MTTSDFWRKFRCQPIQRHNHSTTRHLAKANGDFDSNSGRIRYEYLAIRVGRWLPRPLLCLLLFNLNVGEMGFRVAVGSYVVAEIGFARTQAVLAQPSAKQLVAQPYAVSVDDVSLAVCRDFGKASLHELCRVMGLPGKPESIGGADVESYCREGRIATPTQLQG
jgi:hypothetical protein